MQQNVMIQRKQRISINLGFIKKDIVFSLSFVLAIASCFVQTPKLEYINVEVMISLFTLMIAIKAFEELKVLDKIANAILSKSKNSRMVASILISLCFVSSMFVTNDVALLTFVPLTIIIGQKTGMNIMETIILQTIAANIGSSLTPMGNPQNLFIFSHYGLSPASFFMTVLFIVLIGMGLLVIFTTRIAKRELIVELPQIRITKQKDAWIWGLVLAVIIGAIFGFISHTIALIVTLMAAVILNRSLFFKIDYLLLVTFICFFIFIGNLSSLPFVKEMASAKLDNSSSVFFSSVFLSQLVSNVPASILLANFTYDWKPLLVGVNVGGLGTLIASLASVISYKLFSQTKPGKTGKYLVKFTVYNVTFLAILTIVQYTVYKYLKIF